MFCPGANPPTNEPIRCGAGRSLAGPFFFASLSGSFGCSMSGANLNTAGCGCGCGRGTSGGGAGGSGARANTITWWTTARLPGTTSIAWTYLSSAKFVGISKYLYSTVPLAGSGYSSVIAMTESGWHIIQPSAYFGCGGRLAQFPSLASPTTLLRIVYLSASLRPRSFTNSPCVGSACHGGIRPCETLSRIDFAQGRASLKVSSDIGAISPGR